MIRVAGGDRRAFAELFDRYAPKVMRFAARFTGDAARAEELSQEIFVKLYRTAKRYRPEARFQTFLFRVATNHCLNEVRRGEYRAEAKDGLSPETNTSVAPDGPEDALWGRELERTVSDALAALSDRERAAFCMARFEGLSYREIATALGASEPAVKSLIHRATLAVARAVDGLRAGMLPARSRA
ncbi:MAG: RNA polymerase sigma factor [Myxococcaceae bacterium]|nr:RNA polymerase sigma factor [Myxococcaceae bacterium]